MMNFYIKKIIDKYNNTSIEMRAAAWYAMSNIVQKIAPWLVMIILTHHLTTKDYGIYSIFMSWLEILEIFITLRIYSNGYVAGLVRDNENKATYTATMQSLSIILILSWMIVYIIFHNKLNYITGLNTPLTILMICSFIGTISFGLWSSRQRVNNQYKKMLFATVAYGLLGPILGALTVFFNFSNPIFFVIAVRTIIQLVVVVPFFISNYKSCENLLDKKLAIDALKYNLPLMPYYLSMILLNHSDRLMIQKINGYEDAALYSVSYSAAMIIFVISGALNLSLQSWLFKELKSNSSIKDKSSLITIGTLIVAFFVIGEIIMAPELILVLGGEKYLEAIWVIPPLAISVIVMFIYQQYVNILFYYKKTKFILFASVFAAVFNIFLNAMFIPKFGYIAGGYTSLISYLIVMILYFFLSKKECLSNGVKMKNYFNTKLQLLILGSTSFLALLMTMVYDKIVARYTLVFILLLWLFITRKKWLAEIRKGKTL